MTQTYNKLYNKLLCTDISAAYDTIGYDIVLKTRPQYLKDRKQQFQLDCPRSLSCETVQGGKMSGLFYNIYQ